MKKKYRFTVFTPTLNRGYIIDKLYKSLCDQTYKDFEWLVIDQGDDDTGEKILKYIEDKKIDIVYCKTPERKGINRAYNDALKKACGELFFKVDSDDVLSRDALEELDFYEKSIGNKREKYAGVSGLRGYKDGTIIGDKWIGNEKIKDVSNLNRIKTGLDGDKAEAYYTSILREYGGIREFVGETFTSETVLYDKIAADGYVIRWFNKVIYITEYLNDGETVNHDKKLMENPITYQYILDEMIKYPQYGQGLKIRVLCRYFEKVRKSNGKMLGPNTFTNHKFMVYLCWYGSLITKYIRSNKNE